MLLVDHITLNVVYLEGWVSGLNQQFAKLPTL